jgi:hypothetical protein
MVLVLATCAYRVGCDACGGATPSEACQLEDGGLDSGPQDAGRSDAGPRDGGPSDAGSADAGTSDSGPDGGTSDAGQSGPTMGITLILGGTDSNGPGFYGQQVVALATGTIQSFSFYIDPASSATGGEFIELGLYSDDAGVPGSLLATTSAVPNPAPGAWLTLPGTTSVVAGETYWLVYGVSGNLIEYRTGNATLAVLADVPSFGPMPATFPAPNNTGNPWSFYSTVNFTNGDASVGIQQLLPNVDSNGLGIDAQQMIATASGEVQTLDFYIDASSSTTSGDAIELGLYTDDAGAPGALLTSSAAVQNPTPGAWLSLPVSPVPIEIGTPYWLAYEVSGSTITFRSGAYGPLVCLWGGAYGLMPATFPPPDSCGGSALPWSFYATLQP